MEKEKTFFDLIVEEGEKKEEKVQEGIHSFQDLIERNERGKKASFVESFCRIFF